MSETKQGGLFFPSQIDQDDFLRFALFDTFRVKKRWKTPVLFACIMSAFATICFCFRSSREQAALLGGVLLAIGLILPVIWFLLFLSSVKREAKKLGLSKHKAAYYLFLREEGVTITREKEKVEYAWENLHMAWRVKGCIYLYVLPTRAFLMPERAESDAAWDIICRHLPDLRKTDLRR